MAVVEVEGGGEVADAHRAGVVVLRFDLRRSSYSVEYFTFVVIRDREHSLVCVRLNDGEAEILHEAEVANDEDECRGLRHGHGQLTTAKKQRYLCESARNEIAYQGVCAARDFARTLVRLSHLK